MTTSQDGGIGRQDLPPCTTTRITTNLKTIIPKISRKLTLWKSDNQGFKEAIFIQMGKRGRVEKLGQREHGVVWSISGTEGPTFTRGG